MGVQEVRAPDGRRWWVKRAWVPRYRTLREQVSLRLAERPPRWWDGPLRWAAGPPRYRDTVPTGTPLAVGSERRPRPEMPDARDLLDPVPGPWPAGGPAGGDPATSEAAARLLDMGGGGDVGALDAGGGGDLVGDLAGAGPSLGAGGLDVGGGSDLVGDVSGSGGGGAIDSGGSGGGGFDVDGDGPEILVVIAAVVVAVVAAVAVLGLLWFVVVPFLLLFVDGALLLGLVLAAGLVRLLFRRPWDVVAVEDLEGGRRRIRRWEVRGFRRAGRARDDVARALATGTDPDLAVVRVLVRDPRDDDRAGSARSVTEIEGEVPHPAEDVVSERDARRAAYPWNRRGGG